MPKYLIAERKAATHPLFACNNQEACMRLICCMRTELTANQYR